MISKTPWKGFDKKNDVVGCFVCVDGKFLLIQRAPNKPEGGTWALAGGKVEEREEIVDALVRESFEETGIVLDLKKVIHSQTYYVNIGLYDFAYHVYTISLPSYPEIHLDMSALSAHVWVTPQQALMYNLIQDGDVVIRDFYKIFA
ncbi:MAG: NUDIX hydrolase [Candidatus Roizmanbacteria bacterium]